MKHHWHVRALLASAVACQIHTFGRSGRCAAWVKVKNPITSAEGARLCISICVGTSILPGMPREQRIKAAREIVAEAQKTTGPQPIDTAPRELEKTLLLFCPEQAVGKRGSGRTSVGYRQRVSRSS